MDSRSSGKISGWFTLAVPVVSALVAYAHEDQLAKAYEQQPVSTGVAVLLFLGVSALHLLAWFHALGGRPIWCKRTAELTLLIQAVCLIAYTMIAISGAPESRSVAWLGGWIHPPWSGTVNLLPLLTLLQWVYAANAVGSPAERVWRGVAIGAISFSAVFGVMGARVSRPGEATPFLPQPAEVCFWFFLIGTLLHIIAIWRLAVCRRYAWPWAMFIGFGCLAIGSALLQFRREVNFTDWRDVREMIDAGWNGLAPVTLPLAYVIVATAGIALYVLRDRSQATSPVHSPAE